MQTKTKKRIGILRGGAGKHYVSSLKKGGEIISHISENFGDKYKICDILIDKDHIWHMNGVFISPVDLAQKVDLVWNVSHPSLSNILNSLSIPNIGASSFTHVLENSKEILREHMKEIGLYMPRAIVLPLYQKDFDGPREKYVVKKAKEVFEKFSAPWIVKPFTEEPDMGIHLAKTFPELVSAIEDVIKKEISPDAKSGSQSEHRDILVEEFIAGKVASVHSVSGFRGENIYIFPSISIANQTRPLSLFSFNEKELLSNVVKNLRQNIGARHYLKSDFILTPKGKIYLLEIDGTPDLKPKSHFSQACESIGAKPHHVVEHILESSF